MTPRNGEAPPGRKGAATEPAARAEAYGTASTPATCLQQSPRRPAHRHTGLDAEYLPSNATSVGLAITALKCGRIGLSAIRGRITPAFRAATCRQSFSRRCKT
ncbi:hypothetical protein ON010_g14936 [Phytophthora cinnamomi]|nr:hypothetical protein ON010_g14936 [Phytophthora cinnamomi]